MALPLTDFEKDGVSFTSLANEQAYLTAVAAASEGRMEYAQVGESVEGRRLDLVRIGYPYAPSYAELRGRNPIMVVALQHGDEVCGREAVLAWIRDMATTEDPNLLNILATRGVVVIPTANPDSFPLRRNNSNNNNINRTHTNLLDEGLVIQTVVRDAQPCIGLDMHEDPATKDNVLSLAVPDNIRMATALPSLHSLAESMRQFVGAVADVEGFGWSGYGISGSQYNPAWLHHCYGARGVIGMLVESQKNHPHATRIAGHRLVLQAVLDWYAAHESEIMAFVGSRAAEAIEKGSTQERFRLYPTLVDPAPKGYIISAADRDAISLQLDTLEIQSHPTDTGDYYISLAQPSEPVIPWIVDPDSQYVGMVVGERLFAEPPLLEITYEADIRFGAGPWQPLYAGVSALETEVDPAGWPVGPAEVRHRARSAETDEAGEWSYATYSIEAAPLAIRPLFAPSAEVAYPLTITQGVPAGVIGVPAPLSAEAAYPPAITEGAPPSRVVIIPIGASAEAGYAPALVEGTPPATGVVAPAFGASVERSYALTLLAAPVYYTEGAVRIDRPTVGMAGLRRRLVLLRDGEPYDPAVAGVREITLIRPDGSRVTRGARLARDSEGRPCIEYTVGPEDWTEPGVYTEVGYVEDALGRWPAEAYRYRVHPALVE